MYHKLGMDEMCLNIEMPTHSNFIKLLPCRGMCTLIGVAGVLMGLLVTGLE